MVNPRLYQAFPGFKWAVGIFAVSIPAGGLPAAFRHCGGLCAFLDDRILCYRAIYRRWERGKRRADGGVRGVDCTGEWVYVN